MFSTERATMLPQKTALYCNNQSGAPLEIRFIIFEFYHFLINNVTMSRLINTNLYILSIIHLTMIHQVCSCECSKIGVKEQLEAKIMFRCLSESKFQGHWVVGYNYNLCSIASVTTHTGDVRKSRSTPVHHCSKVKS